MYSWWGVFGDTYDNCFHENYGSICDNGESILGHYRGKYNY